jgi:5'(3')-deoxyribonucleotidase
MNIAIDLDNTILNTPATIINLHNRLSNNKLEYNDTINLGWKFNPIIKTDEELTELFKLFDNSDFYKEAITYKNAIEIVNKLSMQNKVIIISKHMESRKPLTREWVNRIFPTVGLAFVDNFEDKGQILKEYDLIIDDRVDALESCKNIVPYRICFGDYTWNQEWSGIKFTDWNRIFNFVKTINQIRKIKTKYN